MDLRRSCATLYLPTRGGATRRVAVPGWAALAACLGVPGAAALSVMLSLGAGPHWLVAGSPLARENALLRATMAGLDEEVADLSAEMALLAEERGAIASALALPADDGQGPRPGATMAGDARRLALQARLDRGAWEGMADSLGARAAARALVPAGAPCATGWTSSVYGPRLDPFTGRRSFHRGIDISVPRGTAVRATAGGTVAAVERQAGLGLVVKVDHGPGVQTVYAHLERALVNAGDTVEPGAVIARSGNTGRSSAPHLHYEVRLDGRAVNPRRFLGEPGGARAAPVVVSR